MVQKRDTTGHDDDDGTPLWRNGPREKPVLCNACGSRFRTKGTLENYAPKHVRGASSSGGTAEKKPGKSGMKKTTSYVECSSTSEDDTDNNLSSDSEETPNPQSFCGNKEAADEGEDHKKTWKQPSIPCRKRSFKSHRNLSPIELLKQQFANILKHEDISVFTEKEEDVLIYNNNNLQIAPNEIGLGAVLLEPSSIPFMQKVCEPSSSLSEHQVADSDTTKVEIIDQKECEPSSSLSDHQVAGSDTAKVEIIDQGSDKKTSSFSRGFFFFDRILKKGSRGFYLTSTDRHDHRSPLLEVEV